MVRISKRTSTKRRKNSRSNYRSMWIAAIFLTVIGLTGTLTIMGNKNSQNEDVGRAQPLVSPLVNAMSAARVVESGKPYLVYGTAWKKDETSRLVYEAIQSGFRFIDTACQPKHYNEKGVGDGIIQAMKQLGLSRSDLFIQTKFTSYNGQDPNRVPYDENAPLEDQVLQSLEVSLRNLRTEYIDSLVLHSPMETHEDTMRVWRVLEEKVEEGTIRQLGISNCYDIDHFKSLYRDAEVKPAVLQNRFYSDSGFDVELREFCADNDIWYQSFWTLTSRTTHARLGSEEIADLAKSKGLTPQTLMYAYMLEQDYLPLCGTTSKKHMHEDVAVMERIQGGEQVLNEDEMLMMNRNGALCSQLTIPTSGPYNKPMSTTEVKAPFTLSLINNIIASRRNGDSRKVSHVHHSEHLFIITPPAIRFFNSPNKNEQYDYSSDESHLVMSPIFASPRSESHEHDDGSHRHDDQPGIHSLQSSSNQATKQKHNLDAYVDYTYLDSGDPDSSFTHDVHEDDRSEYFGSEIGISEEIQKNHSSMHTGNARENDDIYRDPLSGHSSGDSLAQSNEKRFEIWNRFFENCLSNPVDDNVTEDTTATIHPGNSPLHVAAIEGDLNMMSFLLKEGAQTDTRNRENQTAFGICFATGFTKGCNLLLNHRNEEILQMSEYTDDEDFDEEYARLYNMWIFRLLSWLMCFIRNLVDFHKSDIKAE